MKPGFIITSALNTKFGVHKTGARMNQTLDTIASIKEHCPNANITFLEMAGEPLHFEQSEIIQQFVDTLINFTNDIAVKEIYKNDNWDIVKNLTEITCFAQTLQMIQDNPAAYVGVDRFFKISGRYVLNEDFKIADYDAPERKDKIVFAQRRNSQFDTKVTGGVAQQFMSRCWSFPAKDVAKIQKTFVAMRLCMLDILQKGGYLDIEHLLFLYLGSEINILEVEKIGVQGLLGPNGVLVRD